MLFHIIINVDLKPGSRIW